MSEIIKWKIEGKFHADATKCKNEIGAFRKAIRKESEEN